VCKVNSDNLQEVLNQANFENIQAADYVNIDGEDETETCI
jgi:virulence-associated protein VapD